ncbi:mitogen-activated protein kinase kinase kinase 1-like [Saccostrea cucullata]|uniref:mitogen-activated protein kinase kinase kinase 1-like n=1 Tax=Saccostrea cuccullata TaxID=36930 RepID=UPI002ED5FEBB
MTSEEEREFQSDNEEEDKGSDEEYQGPHDWRRRLKPVQFKFTADKSKPPTSATVNRSSSTRRTLEELRESDKPRRIPSWKRHLIEKKKITVKRHGSGAGQSGTNIYRKKSFNKNLESAFQQQVVNSAQVKKKVSPSNSFKQSQALTRNRIAKVLRARLYLLQQSGPNSFLIGGDSPDHKFRVIIGPQNCTCGRGPHCVHVLFVMLRVFQIRESDPRLLSKVLKNYEVEALFKEYHDKMSSRISMKKEVKVAKTQSSSDLLSPDMTPGQSEVDGESVKEEDDTCPICLLEMLEGESLLKCENGCHNRLHHHCISVWFELCRRQNDPLICPLCRADWKSSDIEIKGNLGGDTQLPIVPPNTRAPSPDRALPYTEGVPPERDRLPFAEPIPQEHKALAEPWIQMYGEDLMSCFFSRNWSIRESGIRHLSREAVGVLMKGMGEGKSGVMLSPEKASHIHRSVEICCQILAFMCGDPVYRVYVACLKTLRTVLSYIPCREDKQKSRLEGVLKPIVDAIIIKCTDGNRRTSQLSLSTLVELAKGSEGELCVGSQVSGAQSFDSLDYVIRCATEDFDPETVSWQWLLGRLYLLERFFEEFQNELSPRNPPEGKSADEESLLGAKPSDGGAMTSPERLLTIARFAIKLVKNSHLKVSRMARRVFLLVVKFSIHLESMMEDLQEMLSVLDATSVKSLKKRMSRIADDFNLSEKLVHELHHGITNKKIPQDETPENSPHSSPESTPRCNSPVSASPDHLSEASSTSKGKSLPLVPPNTPIRARRECKYDSKNEESVNGEITEEETISVTEKVLECLEPAKLVLTPREPQEGVRKSPSPKEQTPPPKTPPPIPPRPLSRKGSYEILQVGPILSPPTLPPHVTVLPPPPDVVKCASESAERNKLSLPLPCTTEDKPFVMCDCENKEGCKHRPLPSPQPFELPKKSSLSLDLPKKEPSPPPLESHDFEAQGSASFSSDERTLSSDDSLDRVCRRKVRPLGHFPTAEQGATSSDEILDVRPRGRTRLEHSVSFKSEVASPKEPVVNFLKQKQDDECPCKEEVEREEALALAKAMEVSALDPPKPIVPGLTPTDREEVITIRIQPENGERHTDSKGNGPSLYLESVHWMKGPLLGTGAYSTCYQAKDVKTGVLMAVKQVSFCRNSRSEQESVVETITEEIIMMTKLNHPNVVRIMGATRHGCHFNMFVEWMPGGSISYLLGMYGAFSENVITSYTLQILRGLAYLHENHVLHRDLKGANLLVDSTGQRLRIGDFGAAARLASQATGAGEFQGQLLGTIAFMAPEVLRGENYGRACDVWSVGCVIIEMCTTKPPWNAKDISNHLALIFKIATSMQPPPIPENLSPPIRDILLRCLEQQKKERPTAKELLVHPLFTQYMTSTSSKC